MRKLRVAIIGYGRSGRNIHRKLLSQLTDLFEIVAFVDKDPQRRDLIREENNCEVLSDYIELYGRADIDFVVNSSFSCNHSPISLELLKHGFNVLSEKPAAGSAEDFKKIMKTAEETGKSYYIFQQYRFAPSYRKVKEVIKSGVLGRIVQVNLNYSGFSRRWDWQTVQDFTGGSLFNTGPHPVDQALDLMGFPDEVKVVCFMDRAHTYGDAEDYVKLLLKSPNVPVLEVEISSCNAYSEYTYLVQGTRGTLKGTTNKLDWKYYIDSDEEARKLIIEPLRNEKGEPIYCSEKLKFHKGNWMAKGEEADDFNAKGLMFYRKFYDSMVNKKPFPITQDQVLKQIEVIEESHRQNEKTLNKFIII